jgi:hypothetical protein
MVDALNGHTREMANIKNSADTSWKGAKTKKSQKGSQNYAIDPYLRRNSTQKPLTFSQFPLFGKV